MSQEGKRAMIAAIRRITFAGLILLVVWLILFALKGNIPEGVINRFSGEMPDIEGLERFPESSTWDWTKSLRGPNTPISEMIGQRLPLTLQLIGLTALFSLVIAAILLTIGVFISRITKSPDWLVKVRSILRLVLVSSGASIPIFIVSIFFSVFIVTKWQWVPSANLTGYIVGTAFFCSLLPAWLLVQTGHGILSNQVEDTPCLKLVQDVGIRLVVRLFKLIGFIIITTMAGLGRLLLEGVSQMDLPVVFGVVWVFVVIMVPVKLVAELIEIAYNHFNKTAPLPEQVHKERSMRFAIPKGWLIFSLALMALIILVAIVAPLLAPYGGNEIHLMDRLSQPSSKYLLGTDQLGRDILSRLLYGIRADLLIGLIAAVVLSIVAAAWAIPAAYFRRMNTWIGDTLEDLVMLPRDIICAFPWLILLLFLMSLIVEPGMVAVTLISRLVMLPHAVGMIQEAYRSPPEGKSWLHSVLYAILIVLVFATAGVIFYVSTLSYLGFGTPPGIPELGSILSSQGRQFMEKAPWIAIGPALCLTLVLVIWVMTGDALLERLGFRSKAVWSKTME